jgi:hypothetical protein
LELAITSPGKYSEIPPLSTITKIWDMDGRNGGDCQKIENVVF